MVQGEEDAEDKRQVTLDGEKLRGEEEGKSDLNAQLCIFSPPLSFRHRKKKHGLVLLIKVKMMLKKKNEFNISSCFLNFFSSLQLCNGSQPMNE